MLELLQRYWLSTLFKKKIKFAAAKAGLILVNVNPSYTANELAFVLDKCKIKTIICDNKYRKISTTVLTQGKS